MKSKISSLSKSKDFKLLIKGRKVSSKYLTIFFKKLSDKSNKKLNISFVTKKKIGNAVSRNKAKRRLRNIMHEITKKLNINLNYSYLLIAKRLIIDDKYQKIRDSLLNDFGSIK